MANVTTAVPGGEDGPHAEPPEDQPASGGPEGAEKPQDEAGAPAGRKARGRRKAE